MIVVDGAEFSNFLTVKDIEKEYDLDAEKVQKLVEIGRLKTYCLPSDEKVFSRKDVEREAQKGQKFSIL